VGAKAGTGVGVGVGSSVCVTFLVCLCAVFRQAAAQLISSWTIQLAGGIGWCVGCAVYYLCRACGVLLV